MEAPAPGKIVVGRYRLDRFIGQGGMGVVWGGTDLKTGRTVALKMLRGHARARPDLRRRLLREARASVAVRHPNVVSIYDVFDADDGDGPVIVMDLLEGETLREKLARDERLSLAETASILLPVVSAVRAAHAEHIVHRDLKPDNIFLARDEDSITVKVLDFGIAKLMHEGEPFDSASLTSSGAMLGTPCYMAPEQGFGEPDIDHRADVWALGAILYECLSGGRPVEGDNLGQVLKRLLSEGITPLDRVLPGTPADVAELVAHMLAPNRSERLANLDGVAAVLERYSSDSTLRDVSASRTVVPIRKRKLSKALTAAGAALVVAVVAVLAAHRKPTNAPSDETPLPAPRETATEASRKRPADQGAPTISTSGAAPVTAAQNPVTNAAPNPSMNDESRSLALRAHRRAQPSATTSSASPPPSSTILGGLVAKPPF